MLVNGKSPEGIEATCEGTCPSHSSSVRKLHRSTLRSLKHSLKRQEKRALAQGQRHLGRKERTNGHELLPRA